MSVDAVMETRAIISKDRSRQLFSTLLAWFQAVMSHNRSDASKPEKRHKLTSNQNTSNKNRSKPKTIDYNDPHKFTNLSPNR